MASTASRAEKSALDLPMLLQILGATAALTAFVAFIGATMMWVRFQALELPADRAVAVLPQSTLLAHGAHALAIPVLIALGAVLAAYLIGVLDPQGNPRPSFKWLVLGLVAVALVAVIVFIANNHKHVELIPQLLWLLAALVLAAVVVVKAARKTTTFRPLAWTLFGASVLFGGALAVFMTSALPRLEPVAVVLKDDAGTLSGFLVGQSSDRVYVVPLPGSGDLADPFADADLDRVVEVSRDQVLRLAIREPAGVKADQPGREQAATLLADLQAAITPPTAAAAPVETEDPALTFAPLVHLHADESLWPINVETFLASSTLSWAAEGGCPEEAIGTPDQERLGGGGYSHGAIDPTNCQQRRAPRFASDRHTRPYDTQDRPPSLPVGDGFFLDLAKDREHGEEKVSTEGPQAVFSGTRVFHERHPEPAAGPGAERITYWLFYALGRPPGPRSVTDHFVHQGDWERISVLIKPGPAPRTWVPVSARYHFHNESRDFPWASVRTVGEGEGGASTHPVVFSALGSHASYPRAGEYANYLRLGPATIKKVDDLAQACSKCPVWRTWLLLGDALEQGWYGFGGAWGRVGTSGDTTGPLGPSSYKLGGKERPGAPTIETVREEPEETP